MQNRRISRTSASTRIWQLLCFVLACICLLLTAALLVKPASLFLELATRANQSQMVTGCPITEKVDRGELFNGDVNPFSELHAYEIQEVVSFLHSNSSLELTEHNQMAMNSNYIHLVEMLPPPKRAVISFLEGHGPRPPRMARAFIFRGNASEPCVEEYIVGPLPCPTRMSLMNTTARQTRIPYNLRPFTKGEFKAVYRYVVPGVLRRAGQILEESYNATLFNCEEKCLKLSMTPVSSGFLEAGRRKSWFWFAYDIEFYTLHPLDFQFLVDMTDVDPRKWEVQRIYYANQLFEDIDELLQKYNSGEINKTKMNFPTKPAEDIYSAVYLRGDTVPQDERPPPQQIQPGGPRYRLNGNLLEYMDWRFNIRISPSVGAQLFDIRYKGERIIYELSMQEISVLYSGHSPAASMLYFADSAGLFGTRMRGMMPGVDCPEYGTMLDALVYTSNEKGMKTLENSLCVFEHSPETALRRHRAYGMSGAFYSGLIDHVLVVRMYICIINYDYAFDFVFHNNGAVEVKVSSTGYLATSFYYPEEEKYGTRISETVVAGLHHHLFNFKADVDVEGTDNRFQTWNIGKETKTNLWADNPTRSHSQNFFVKQDRRSEKEAAYSFDFNNPKYLLFYNNRTTELGHTPAYRLIHKGMTKSMLPEGAGFEPSVTWGRHQLTVTKQKDDEMTSSSMFAMWDAQDPVVHFKKYLEDDENIVDEDLVAWITLGTYHIPQMENVPNTATVGTTQSFFLVPFNYFSEDPSLGSRDSVKIMPRDPQRPLDGAIVNRHNMTQFFNCESERIDRNLFYNSTFLFS